MQTDADKQGHIAGTEPSDLDAILKRLRELMAGNIDTEYAAARILAALGLKTEVKMEMDDKEFKDALKSKESEIEDLKFKLDDAIGKIKEFEEKEKQNYIKIIKKFGEKYSDEELQGKTLQSLAEIADAVSRFAPSESKGEPLPVANKPPKKKMEDEMGEAKRIDFSNVFEDVDKEFNMYGLN